MADAPSLETSKMSDRVKFCLTWCSWRCPCSFHGCWTRCATNLSNLKYSILQQPYHKCAGSSAVDRTQVLLPVCQPNLFIHGSLHRPLAHSQKAFFKIFLFLDSGVPFSMGLKRVLQSKKEELSSQIYIPAMDTAEFSLSTDFNNSSNSTTLYPQEIQLHID